MGYFLVLLVDYPQHVFLVLEGYRLLPLVLLQVEFSEGTEAFFNFFSLRLILKVEIIGDFIFLGLNVLD